MHPELLVGQAEESQNDAGRLLVGQAEEGETETAQTFSLTELFFRNTIVLWSAQLNKVLLSGAVGLGAAFWSFVSMYTMYQYIIMLTGVMNI